MTKNGLKPITNRLAAWGAVIALCAGVLGSGSQVSARQDAAKESAQPTAASATTSGIDSMPRLGAELLDAHNDTVLAETGASGAKVVRLRMSWELVEPSNTTPPGYSWGQYDGLLANLAAKGLAPLLIVTDCPLWACPTEAGPLDSDRYGEFAQFMDAVAARYSAPPYNVHYWEFWNEPDGVGESNGQWGWGMNPGLYAQMLAAVYPSIKARDPQSVVMMGGIAYDNFQSQGGPFNQNFLSGVLAAGGGQYMDAVAFHYYKNNAHGWTNIGVKAEAIRDVLEAHGVNLPLICTETGLTSSAGYGSSEAIQARYLVQMFTHGAAAGVRNMIWYTNKDFNTSDPTQAVFAESGLLTLGNSRKLSHASMSTYAAKVGSGAFLRALGTADGVSGTLEGYRFRNADGSRLVSVVWNNGSGSATLSIPASQAPELARVSSLYGAAVPYSQGPGGTLLVAVGPDPVYLEWRIRFEDVPSQSWMFEYIEYLASRNIIGGYADGTFRPGNPATRGQFSKMISLGMNWPLASPASATFYDVAPGSTFYPYVETAVAHGVIGGYPCGGPNEPCDAGQRPYFRPGNNITRGQISKIVTLALGWQLLDPATASFTDVPRGSTFFQYVETMVSRGIVGGYTDGTFRPGNNATRAQLSKMLALSLQQQ